MNPIITSLLDTDYYKLNMQRAVLRLFPDERVQYKFVNRGQTVFDDGFLVDLYRQVGCMGNLSLTGPEANYLLSIGMPIDYVNFLREYRFNPEEVEISETDDGGLLSIDITGSWLNAILWEVPLMAIISELYFQRSSQQPSEDLYIREKNLDKRMAFNRCGAKVAEFGTRRRYSKRVQELVYRTLARFYSTTPMIGTSNVELAMKTGTNPIGTQAHEWFQFHGVRYGLWNANDAALRNWVSVYRGALGIALTDTYTTGHFFRAFDGELARVYDGVRHDSGDPIDFGERMIEHYVGLGIDPTTKTIVFSDGLNPEAVTRIQARFRGRVKTVYGIGTNLTNDVGVTPLNMVIKMWSVWQGDVWTPTVKLSDVPGKNTGVPDAIDRCKKTLNL